MPATDLVTSDAASVGIMEQSSVAALHHRIAEAREAHRAVAEVVGFPAALRNARSAEKSCGNLAIAGLVESRVEGADREHQTIPPWRRQGRRITASTASQGL